MHFFLKNYFKKNIINFIFVLFMNKILIKNMPFFSDGSYSKKDWHVNKL